MHLFSDVLRKPWTFKEVLIVVNQSRADSYYHSVRIQNEMVRAAIVLGW